MLPFNKQTNIKLLACSCLTAVSFAPVANAEILDIPGEFSATTGFASEYVFRGITQTNEEPAIQGSIDYSAVIGDVDGKDVGLYFGVWASNVEFNDNNEASTEFDFYGGVTHEVAGIEFDIGAIYYAYPGAAANLNYDFWEAKFGASYDFGSVALGGAINYSPNYFGDSGDATYYQATAEVPLKNSVYIGGHIGRQEVDDNNAFALPDYTDWSVGIGANIKGFDVKVSYVDTNISKANCADGCDGKALLTISKAL